MTFGEEVVVAQGTQVRGGIAPGHRGPQLDVAPVVRAVDLVAGGEHRRFVLGRDALAEPERRIPVGVHEHVRELVGGARDVPGAAREVGGNLAVQAIVHAEVAAGVGDRAATGAPPVEAIAGGEEVHADRAEEPGQVLGLRRQRPGGSCVSTPRHAARGRMYDCAAAPGGTSSGSAALPEVDGTGIGTSAAARAPAVGARIEPNLLSTPGAIDMLRSAS
jgi:hypothetical protein